MKVYKSLFATLVLLTLVFASAQDFNVLGFEDYTPFGDFGFDGYEPYDTDGGALILTGSVPTDQDPNVSITGPDGTIPEVEIEGAETVVEDLTPGVYAIGATEDGLQLAAATVEVREGEATRVNFNLVPINDADYVSYDYYEPYGTYETGAYEPFDYANVGGLRITTNEPDEAEIEITGPDGYRASYKGDLTLSRLTPGPYQVAVTEEGYQVTEGIVEVRAGELAEVSATLEPLNADTEDED